MTAPTHPSPHSTGAVEIPAEPPPRNALTEIETFILQMLEQLDAVSKKAEHLERALQHSRDIGAAVGVLMAHHTLRQDEAFDLLRHASQDLNRKLYDVALDVVSTGELPSRALTAP